MALAGLLLRAGWSEEETDTFLCRDQAPAYSQAARGIPAGSLLVLEPAPRQAAPGARAERSLPEDSLSARRQSSESTESSETPTEPQGNRRREREGEDGRAGAHAEHGVASAGAIGAGEDDQQGYAGHAEHEEVAG